MALRNGAETGGTLRHSIVTLAVTMMIAVIACLAGCSPLPAAEPLVEATCSVTDGDTIRCGNERIRLLGIDAPELRRCREGRRCVEGDGRASQATLQALLRGKALSVVRLGEDRYQRTLGVIYADGANMSCAMIAAGQAQYVRRWDNEGAVARDCPQVSEEN